MTSPLLELEDVSIRFGDRRVVKDLSLHVGAGERVALVGESGSGKTVTALSILRLLPQAQIEGSIRFRGAELSKKTNDELRRVRGADVAMIFQEPMTALNPLYSIGDQVSESLMLHEGLGRAAARARAIEMLARTGLLEPERRADAFPHQLSGGERQRAMIAMALACHPRLLIADEPTTALDLTLRARIVELLLHLQQQESERAGAEPMAILLITHDLSLVRRFADRVAVMERGELVETGATSSVLTTPRHTYTRRLLDSAPVRSLSDVPEAAKPILSLRRVRVEYPKRARGLLPRLGSKRFVALEGADLVLREGETVGVVGESGSGKSTLAQAILRLVKVHSGSVVFEQSDIAQRDRETRRRVGARLQVVFQDPFGSLSPRLTLRQIVGEGLELHFPELTPAERHERIVSALTDVGLPESSLDARPHEFSGGQRQRIAIARALVISPRLLILDEPTSALDVSIQSQVLGLLLRLQQKYGLSYLLISHDLSVINALAHRVYVMQAGKIVESGDTEAVIASPRHPYTKRLVEALHDGSVAPSPAAPSIARPPPPAKHSASSPEARV